MTPSIMTVGVERFMLSLIYADCCNFYSYVECLYAECCYAECCYAEYFMLSVVMLNVVMLNILC